MVISVMTTGSINHQFMIGFVTLSLSLPPSPSVKTAGGSGENGGYFITPLYILRYTTIKKILQW